MLGFLSTTSIALAFGIFASFGSNYQFMPLIYSILMLILAWEFHILMYAFWMRIMHGFSTFSIFIELDLKVMIRASRCGVSSIIGLMAVLGRVAPK